MFGSTLRVLLAAGMSVWPASLPAQTISDAEVAKGMRQVEDGDHDAAIFTLDGAVRHLGAGPSHPRDLPQAYLYLGVAFGSPSQQHRRGPAGGHHVHPHGDPSLMRSP